MFSILTTFLFKNTNIIKISLYILLVISLIGSILYINVKFNNYEKEIYRLNKQIDSLNYELSISKVNNATLKLALDNQNKKIAELNKNYIEKKNELDKFLKTKREDRYTGKLKTIMKNTDDDFNKTLSKAMELDYEDF